MRRSFSVKLCRPWAWILSRIGSTSLLIKSPEGISSSADIDFDFFQNPPAGVVTNSGFRKGRPKNKSQDDLENAAKRSSKEICLKHAPRANHLFDRPSKEK